MLASFVLAMVLNARSAPAAVPFDEARKLAFAALDLHRRRPDVKSIEDTSTGPALTASETRELNAYVRGRSLAFLGVTPGRAKIGLLSPGQWARLGHAHQALGAAAGPRSNQIHREVFNALVQLNDQMRTRFMHRRNLETVDYDNQLDLSHAEDYRYAISERERLDFETNVDDTAWQCVSRMDRSLLFTADLHFVKALKTIPDQRVWHTMAALFTQRLLSVLPVKPSVENEVGHEVPDRTAVAASVGAAIAEALEGIRNPEARERVQQLARWFFELYEARDCEFSLNPFTPLHPALRLAARHARVVGKIGLAMGTVAAVKQGWHALDVVVLSAGGDALINAADQIGNQWLDQNQPVINGSVGSLPVYDAVDDAHAARILDLTPEEWAAKVKQLRAPIPALDYAGNVERVQTALTAALLEHVLTPRRPYRPTWLSAFYPRHRLHSWRDGGPAKAELVVRSLGTLGVTAEPGLHRSDRVLRGFDVDRDLLLAKMPELYFALGRLNLLPWTPLVKLALEVLLEIEAHATRRYVRYPIDSVRKRFSSLFETRGGGDGISLIDRQGPEVRELFQAWLLRQERTWRNARLSRGGIAPIPTRKRRAFIINEIANSYHLDRITRR